MAAFSLPSPAVLSSLPVGVAFGLLLEKSKVYLPYLIMEQLRFTRFNMLQIFMTATATSTIAVLLLDRAGITKRQPRPASELGFLIPGSFGANILGGVGIGVGMALTGACPGTVYVQLGTGVPTAPLVAGGCLFAAMAFGYLCKRFSAAYKRFMAAGSKATVSQMLGLSDTAVTAGFAGICLSIAVAVGRSFPWAMGASQVSSMNASEVAFSFNPMHQVWSPIAAGIGIGLTQLSSLLFSGNPLGASSSYCVAAAHTIKCVDSKVEENAPYFKSFLASTSISHVLMVVGMVAGGWLSTHLSGADVYPFGRDNLPVNQVTPVEAFVGGAILLAGSRLAGGCPSGHGISGMAMLGVSSFVTVASMFGGGMLTIAIRDYLKA